MHSLQVIDWLTIAIQTFPITEINSNSVSMWCSIVLMQIVKRLQISPRAKNLKKKQMCDQNSTHKSSIYNSIFVLLQVLTTALSACYAHT